MEVVVADFFDLVTVEVEVGQWAHLFALLTGAYVPNW